MQIAEFLSAIKMLADEKGLSEPIVVEAVESALAAAYRKDFGKPGQIIKVELNTQANTMKVFQVYNVLTAEEEKTNPEAQLTLDEAKKFNKKIEEGGTIEIPLEAKYDFGRVAAQTAKQVIIQKLREAEREVLYEEFKSKENKIVNATVQRIEGQNVIVDLGKINGIMLVQDQIPGERYYTGQKIKVFVKEVEETAKGPRILASRSEAEFVKGLFMQEVPEIEAGSIEIVQLSREAGSRTKVAVRSNDENLDPVGSVVGQRGTRVQAVLSELGGEKIDIILYDEDIETLMRNALSPATIDKVKFDKKNKVAKIWVPDDQLSLAIGKSGQNVRLASKLTGWEIDIVKDENNKPVKEESKSEEKSDEASTKEEESPAEEKEITEETPEEKKEEKNTDEAIVTGEESESEEDDKQQSVQ
jgi:N utilization substance protein A